MRFRFRFAPLGLLVASALVVVLFSCTETDYSSPPSTRLPGLTATRTTASGCAAQSTMCSGSCTDLKRDPDNCGVCGKVCGVGMKCDFSGCVLASGYAVRKIFYGDTDRAGVASTDAWKKYGRNIDGITSTGAAGGALKCKPLDGAPSTHHEDGEGGIDNSFGRNILPLLTPFIANPSQTATANFEGGARTNIVELVSWSGDIQFDPDVNTRFLRGEKLNTARWDGKDIRDSVPSVGEPISGQVFAAELNAGVYQSKATGAFFKFLDIDLAMGAGDGGGGILTLSIRKPALTMRISTSQREGSEGMISGFVMVSELETAIAKLLGRSNKDLCSGPTALAMKQSIRQAADVLSTAATPIPLIDGGTSPSDDAGTTSEPPTQDCDAISIGIGFEASLVVVGKKREPDPLPSDPCAP